MNILRMVMYMQQDFSFICNKIKEDNFKINQKFYSRRISEDSSIPQTVLDAKAKNLFMFSLNQR